MTDSSQAYKITGLVNGKLYAVTAMSYKQIPITKSGKVQKVNFYGSETARKIFMPMSKPFNVMVSYPVKDKNKSVVTCTADKAAEGIIVSYRPMDTTGDWTAGCRTTGGQFSCTVNIGRGYDFQIRKYTGSNYGPGVIVEGRN